MAFCCYEEIFSRVMPYSRTVIRKFSRSADCELIIMADDSARQTHSVSITAGINPSIVFSITGSFAPKFQMTILPSHVHVVCIDMSSPFVTTYEYDLPIETLMDATSRFEHQMYIPPNEQHSLYPLYQRLSQIAH
jgi:hypothetical protein